MTAEFHPARGRLNGSGPVAVVDIGSNSVRLVIYERKARTPTMLFNEKLLAGLGKGIAATGRLADDSVSLALGELTRFKTLIKHTGCQDIYIVATAAARDAENGPDFVREVERFLEAPVRILDGNEEAYYSALGVIAGFWQPRGIVGDMGGGSLELVEIADNKPGTGATFPLGGLRLSEEAEGKIAKAQKITEAALKDFQWPDLAPGERTFYAVGGTWRSLGRLHLMQNNYPLHVMHNYEISAEEAIAFCKRIAIPNLEGVELAEIVSKQRRPLVPIGAVVLEQVLTSMKAERLVFSATGVREGLLHEKLPSEMQAHDPVIEAARELCTLRARSPAHAEELIVWTDKLFKELGIEETANETRLRHAACLLSDIGWRAHPDYRGEQSLNIISNASFVGLDHASRAYLAAAVFYRHQGLREGDLSPVIRELFTDRLRIRAKVLGATMRVASLLSASIAGMLPKVGITKSETGLSLDLGKDLADLDGERLRKRANQLSKVIDVDVAVNAG
ncbi:MULTISPECIES: Ppx/GppA phosphatase family protein [Stappiaceae]|jgi:exopolyphosphatase / guanosine-5'-triphosphate,3'-diphosphate pyrophosphatase|uniref:Exopolyphosphatase n=1 Tax=Roseibium aggregatum TaxID=187304 RepID=A0A0M6XWP1_9HYPH|nr:MULTISPECIES: Ppx/GppA phosphatase family protein [Stappiaceae]MEC9404957.1 Ppx/GppA phosphatase family protein [Pseudomonadota bacterium]MBO6858890.1 Ppx/GppA family phosphatase [Roseibium sp.]MEE2867609.1 Ppx/GppA phosphatase family protein [Pseudomonadota bacterium]QFT69788.1 Exopolyphosphatase [Labrenzia sp. THAF35]CTQ41837.1 Exopolyphosphatase [Roseibium aggregatum]